MQPHQQRVIDEQFELAKRHAALDSFLDTKLFNELDSAEKSRLRLQFSVMSLYMDILGQRIKAFAAAKSEAE
jgi:hypothetical protein